MGDRSGIQWTDATWNPVRGCSRVSAGCDNCYAIRQAHRQTGGAYAGLTTIRKDRVDWTGVVRLVPELLDQPLRWKRPRRIFVNSMSDLFHESLPDEVIAAVFAVMHASPHTFQVLTKRPKRMLAWVESLNQKGGIGPYIRSIRVDGDRTTPNLFTATMRTEVVDGRTYRAMNDPWMVVFNAAAVTTAGPADNVWLGVSVEDQASADERIPLLLQTPAAVRFVSYEPALGPVDFDRYLYPQSIAGLYADPPWDLPEHKRLDWIIVGGESGHGARPFDVAWARSTIGQCRAASVPCFYKQGGSSNRCEHDAKGGHFDCFPVDLKVREFPDARS